MSEEPSKSNYDVIVVGGGAAGIMAAFTAAEAGAQVALLEKNERLGKKILISGGGKCNITNAQVELSNYHGTHPRFVQDVLRAFDEHDLVAWMNDTVGVETYEGENYGKIWPKSNMSKTVAHALEALLVERGVRIFKNTWITEAERQPEGKERNFSVKTESGKYFQCLSLVMATGGLAAPHLGSDDSGLIIAERFGHKLIEQFPALVALTTEESWSHELAGLTCEDVMLTLVIDGRERLFERGSLLFTHSGITSPAVFRLSREATEAIENGKPVVIRVNFRADGFKSQEDANKLLHHALGSNTKKRSGTVVGWVVGFRRLGDALVCLAGADPDKRVREIQKRGRDALEELIYRCPFTITGSLGWARAEVMRGGVDVRKVDPRSMASKVINGLFICGEMLDIDADVGGFNFQFAFASGKAAGEAAAEAARTGSPSS